MKQKNITLLLILLGAAGLLYPVWYNTYPLVYSDTGAYLWSGFLAKVPPGRPIVYGLLMRYLSLSETLFLSVVGQAILVSLSIYCACKQLIQGGIAIVHKTYSVCMLALILFTGLPWFTAWIMPDVFSGVVSLLLLTLLFSKVSLSQNKGLLLLYVVLTLTHLSNLLSHVCVMLLLTFIVSIYSVLKKSFNLSLRRSVAVLLIAVANYGWMMAINYSIERWVFVSKSSELFLTAKFCQYGLVNSYLDNYCSDKTPQLCALKDSIPPDLGYFLWSPNSVLYKMGGWEAPSKEFSIMNREILKTPELLETYIIRGLEESYDQLFSMNVGQDFLDYGDSSSAPFSSVSWFVKRDVSAYLDSKQNASQLSFPFSILNTAQYYLILVLYLIVFVIGIIKIATRTGAIFLATICLLAGNALVCAFLTSVGGRYQGRVVWILVVIVGIELVNNRAYLLHLLKGKKVEDH